MDATVVLNNSINDVYDLL